MTMIEDFLPPEESRGLGATLTYPTMFGITLTPGIGGVVIAVLGLAGFLYLVVYQVMPTWQKHQELEASVAQKQAQVQQEQGELAQKEKIKSGLEKVKQQQKEVLSLFANENTLDTLLLDLDRLVETDNAKVSGGVKAKLTKFVPVVDSSNGAIVDNSLGSEVNGKLKSRAINVAIQGTFTQTESILRDIERLQPLLIIKDYQSTLNQAPPINQQGKVVGAPQTISTAFQLQALIPLSAEEVAKASSADAAKQPPK